MAGGINGPPVLNGPAYVYPTKTLAALRDELLTMLGFPDPLTGIDSETLTLVELREKIIRRCGFYYNPAGNPAGQNELIDDFINEAQQTTFRTAELDKSGVTFPARMTADIDPTEIDYSPVYLLGLGLAKAHYGQNDSKAYFEQFQKYLNDRALRRPPKIVSMCNQWLILAQKKLYRRYKTLRNNLWWTIAVTAGERIYDVPYDADSELDFKSATEAWLVDGFTWLPLTGGINAQAFTTDTPSVPTRFEFREFFEIWPAPEKAYTAKIKGQRGLLVFTDDAHVTTLDPEVILIQALIWGKRHFNDRATAKEYQEDLDDWIGALNGGLFAGMRFVPRGTQPEPDPLPYPQVTFPRT